MSTSSSSKAKGSSRNNQQNPTVENDSTQEGNPFLSFLWKTGVFCVDLLKVIVAVCAALVFRKKFENDGLSSIQHFINDKSNSTSTEGMKVSGSAFGVNMSVSGSDQAVIQFIQMIPYFTIYLVGLIFLLKKHIR